MDLLNSRHTAYKWIGNLSLAALTIYFFFRAKFISLTWDEAYTYFEFVRNTDWLPHHLNYMSANDHLLNTWLMKISVAVFGESELALRLPNVAAGIVFLFSFRSFLRNLFRDELLILAAFLLVATNPFLIDFFSIARGYGIALACMMIALNNAIRFMMVKEFRWLYRSQLWFILSTLAVISFLYVFMGAMIFLFFYVIVRTPRIMLWRSMVFFFFIPILFAIPFLPYMICLQRAGAFYLGKEITDPVVLFGSLADATLYSTTIRHVIPSILGKIFLLIPCVSLVYILTGRVKRNTAVFQLFTITAISAIVIPIAMHYTMGSNLITGRAAVFCIPLLLLLFILQFSAAKWERALIIALALAATVNGVYRMNIRIYYDWSEQADVKDAMKILRDQRSKPIDPFYANVISTDLPYDMPMNYYRMRYGMTEFGHAERREFLRNCGYYYLPMEDSAFYRMADIIHYFPETKTALFRLLDPPPSEYRLAAERWYDFEYLLDFDQVKEDTMFFGNRGTWSQFPEHEFTMTLHLDIPDSLQLKDLAATLSCRIRTDSKNTAALLVFDAKAEHTDSWEAMHVSELPEKTGEWSLTGWTRVIPQGTKQLNVYIWNRNTVPVYLDNVSIRLLKKQE